MSVDLLVGTTVDWLLSSSIQLLLFVPLVALLNHALRNLPARVRHAVWMLVLVKALLPPQLSAAWGIGTFATEISEQARIPLLALFFDPTRALHGASVPPGVAIPTARAEFGSLLMLDRSLGPTICGIMCGLWLGGVALALSSAALLRERLTGAVRAGRTVTDGPLHAALAAAARAEGLAVVPRLVLSSRVGAPFAMGLFRPVIVLPSELPGLISPAELAAVLRHECIHLRRGDPLVVAAQVFVQAIFWFHPLVWHANAQLALEREFAVDEAAAGRDALGVVEYARALVNVALACSSNGLRGVLAFLVLSRSRNEVVVRVERLLAPRRESMASLALGWAAVAIFALVFIPMGPLSPGDGRPMPPPGVTAPR